MSNTIATPAQTQEDARIDALERQMSERVGFNVSLIARSSNGEFTIVVEDQGDMGDDLEALCLWLKAGATAIGESFTYEIKYFAPCDEDPGDMTIALYKIG